MFLTFPSGDSESNTFIIWRKYKKKSSGEKNNMGFGHTPYLCTDKQTELLTDEQPDIEKNQNDGQMNRHTDGQTDRWIDRRMDRWIGEKQK